MAVALRHPISYVILFALFIVLFCIYLLIRHLKRERFFGKKYWITQVPYSQELYRAQHPGQFYQYRLPGGPVPM